MRRPQFSLRTLFWLMAVVAALFMGWEGHRQKEEWVYQKAWKGGRNGNSATALRVANRRLNERVRD